MDLKELTRKLLALPREKLLALGNLDETDVKRLNLGEGDLVWCSITGGDGSVWPGGRYSKGATEAVAEAIGTDAEDLANALHEADGAKAVNADHVIESEGSWDFRSPACTCGECWDAGGQKPRCQDPLEIWP